MTYEQAAEYIENIPRFTKKNEPGNTIELLSRLGHPEEAYRIIHVAGTNGKGSVCAYLESILRTAGYRTGLFTSPHLVRLTERFQVNRNIVSDEIFLQAFCTVMDAVRMMEADGFHHPTYFELLFAVGCVIFRREKIDLLVLETGLGGRLDATNTVARPDLTVITSVSLDHCEYLGDTVSQIAAEKAGIIKEGVPVVYEADSREASRVISERARELHAPAVPVYRRMGEIRSYMGAGIEFVLNNRYYDYIPVAIPFLADYQMENCILAMTALRVFDKDRLIPREVILEGVRSTVWRGRMETVRPGIVLDGAHNADGISQFLRTVKRVSKRAPVSLLFAAVKEKDHERMIRELTQEVRFSSITVTEVKGKRRIPCSILADEFRRCTDSPVMDIANPREAFEEASKSRGEGVLFCAGSLYLIGEIEAFLDAQGTAVPGEKDDKL